MDRLISLFSLKPIIFGFIGMLISGITFPLAGVVIVRNSLIPMRYMLMHGVILGGIFSIALGIPLLFTVILINILLVLIILAFGKDKLGAGGLSTASTVMMVCTMGIASLLAYVFDVPAKDTLELLWGSPFTLTKSDLIILSILGILILLYVCLFFRQISMLFFDKDIAVSMKVNVRLHNFLMLIIIAIVISVAMKMIGALLIDALVILPVVTAGQNAKSLKDLFVKSSIFGVILSIFGYFIALIYNLPVSGILAILSIFLVIFMKISRFFVKNDKI